MLVDSSVWVDYFASGQQWQTRILDEAVDNAEKLCICGIILAEVLQGFRVDSDYRRALFLFDALQYLPDSREAHLRAANIYRGLRSRGITVRSTVDCLISAIALMHDVPLLHCDRNFGHIERHFGLRTVHKV